MTFEDDPTDPEPTEKGKARLNREKRLLGTETAIIVNDICERVWEGTATLSEVVDATSSYMIADPKLQSAYLTVLRWGMELDGKEYEGIKEFRLLRSSYFRTQWEVDLKACLAKLFMEFHDIISALGFVVGGRKSSHGREAERWDLADALGL